jgi:hypothetical protein
MAGPVWWLISLILVPVTEVAPAYVTPVEMHITYVAEDDARAWALAFASFATKGVQQRVGYKLVEPDPFSQPGTIEVHLGILIEQVETIDETRTHRAGLAWEVWVRDGRMKRINIWRSGLDMAQGTADNLVHIGGQRVKHGISAILDSLDYNEQQGINRILNEYRKNIHDL